MATRQQYLRCRVCGGPAFDCKCWAVEGGALEIERCERRLARGDLLPGIRRMWERQLAAARTLHAFAVADQSARESASLW